MIGQFLSRRGIDGSLVAMMVISVLPLTSNAAPAVAPSRQPADLQTPTKAASPPALSLDEVTRQPMYGTSSAQFEALRAKAVTARRPLPDWNGVWLNQSPYQFEPGKPFTVRTTAPLNTRYATIYSHTLENAKRGRDWDPLSACLPAGYPRMLAENRPFEFIVTPRQVWILGELMNEAHRIFTDDRGHIAEEEAYPLWDGDSIGFWDDDTLIVHTTHLMETKSGYQRNGPFQSSDVSTVEQWRMLDKNTIVVQITVYDPKVFTAPWRPAPRFYRRGIVDGRELRLEYFNCQGSPVTRTPDGATHLILPGEPGFTVDGR